MGAVLLITYSLFLIKLSVMTESLTVCRSDFRAQAIRESNRQVQLAAVVFFLMTGWVSRLFEIVRFLLGIWQKKGSASKQGSSSTIDSLTSCLQDIFQL